MSETLIDLSINEDETRAEIPESDNIVDEINVEDNRIIISTILDEYNSLVIGNLSELRSKSVNEFVSKKKLSNIDFPKKIIEVLQEIKLALDMAWSSQHSMYRLRYNIGENGEIKDLYVPMDTEHIEDICVKEVYDDEENFVAEGLRKDLGEQFYRLESADLFVDDIDNPTQIKEAKIRKKEDIAVRELSSNSIKDEITKMGMTTLLATSPIIFSPTSSLFYNSSSQMMSVFGVIMSIVCMTYLLSGVWYIFASIIGDYINNIINYRSSIKNERTYCVHFADL